MSYENLNKCPYGFLFCNGNAVYLDENKQQICEFQGLGWRGLHLFRERYPQAPVMMQYADPIPPEMLSYLLENIIDPRKNLIPENTVSKFLNKAYEFKKTEEYEKMPLNLRDFFNQEIGRFEYIRDY